jgi:periodic tryptophan protein 2
MITRLYAMKRMVNFGIHSIGSHRDCIVACFFEKDSLDITTISRYITVYMKEYSHVKNFMLLSIYFIPYRNGNVCVWESNLELSDLTLWTPPVDETEKADDVEVADDVDTSRAEGTGTDPDKLKPEEEPELEVEQGVVLLNYRRAARHFLRDLIKGAKDVTLTAAAYHKDTHVLVTGFSNGAFFLHEMPDVNLIHSLRYYFIGLSCFKKTILFVYTQSDIKPKSVSSIVIYLNTVLSKIMQFVLHLLNFVLFSAYLNKM